MTILQAAALITLWRTRQFDTFDIASVLSLREADVEKVIHEIRNRERGADLRVVQ